MRCLCEPVELAFGPSWIPSSWSPPMRCLCDRRCAVCASLRSSPWASLWRPSSWRRARTCTSPERCARRDHEVIFALRPEARPGVGVHRASLRQPRQGAARGPSGRSLGGHGLGIMERAKLVDDSDGGDDSVVEPPSAGARRAPMRQPHHWPTSAALAWLPGSALSASRSASTSSPTSRMS